jgi:small-conductance mechanosensitive channel
MRLSLLLIALLLLVPSIARAAEDAQLESPRRALELFYEAAGRGDFGRAADALDLRQVRADQRRARGPELARQLWVVLDRAVFVDPDTLPDEPKPKPDEKSVRVTLVPLRGREVPITLANVSATGAPRWAVSAATVALVPQLYEQYGPGPLESRLPPSLREPRLGWLYVWQWVGLAIAFPVSIAIGRLIAAILGFFAKRVARRTRAKWDDDLVESLRGPTRLFMALVTLRALVEPLALSANAFYALETGLKVSFIGVLGFAAFRVVGVIARTIEERAIEASTSTTGVMRARGVTTQVRVLRRVINIAVGVLSVALMLTQFETVRNVGVSLLASAGLLGIVFGFAAQRTIGSLIAGIQLSATQPIRIGDDVLVEKEFGSIEEITLTYVVVRLWDERRLIVPMTRFLEQPFENWTKLSAAIHGTVIVEADPTLPVPALRAEVDRILDTHPLWDRRTKTVVVLEARERSIQLRVLVSAANASTLFDLRADVRERLVAWLASFEGGRYLVRARMDEVATRRA